MNKDSAQEVMNILNAPGDPRGKLDQLHAIAAAVLGPKPTPEPPAPVAGNPPPPGYRPAETEALPLGE